MTLTDPRQYGAGDAGDPLLELAADEGRRPELVDALRQRAADRRDDEIRKALAAAPSRLVYLRLWHALAEAVEKADPDESVSARVFAIPWVLVCGARVPTTLSGVLNDAPGIARVLDANGVFGQSRSLGLGNALTSMEVLENLPPSEVLDWSRDPSGHDVPPVPIQLTRGAEEVHVRFLLGAAIAPANAPDILETGSNIGQWGTAALRAMTPQLSAEGAEVLAMPRPPAGLYTAAYQGRRAGVETAFNLFMSNAVRQFRMSVGDADVTLSTHEGGEIRVTLTTALDDAQVEGFRWPLHPADDFEEVRHTIEDMVAECRLPDPRYVEHVMPAESSTGAVLFPRH